MPDIKETKGNDYERGGIGFPLLPIFFPIQDNNNSTAFTTETFPMSQIVSCGSWCIEHMNDVDPSIDYVRAFHTDGHRWKLYEVHRSHVKKTKFFEPRASMRQSSNKLVRFTSQPRFFDDYEHMLSVIGLIRFAMGIPENIVMANDAYDVEELPRQPDLQRTIQKSLLSLEQSQGLLRDKKVIREIPVATEERREQLRGEEDKKKQLPDK